MRQFVNGQFVNLDAIGAQFPRHGIAEPGFGIMIFDGYDRMVGFLRGGLNDILGQRLHAVGIDKCDANASILQFIGRLQCFK